MGNRLAFPASKSNSVEIAYISYKNLRYTFDKPAEKIDGGVLVLSSHVEAYDFLGFVEYFSLKLSTTTFPLRCTGQATSCPVYSHIAKGFLVSRDSKRRKSACTVIGRSFPRSADIVIIIIVYSQLITHREQTKITTIL